MYRAYLLRLWKDGADTPWRASLEAVDTGTRHHFATLSQLVHFLETATVEATIGAETSERSKNIMKKGDLLRVKVENVPSRASDADLRNAFDTYGSVEKVQMHDGYAEVAVTWNGRTLLNSSGVGEIRLADSTNLRVIKAAK